MKNRIITLSLLLLSLCAATSLWANNEKPFVIPELRHWQGGEGVVNISAATKVMVLDKIDVKVLVTTRSTPEISLVIRVIISP